MSFKGPREPNAARLTPWSLDTLQRCWTLLEEDTGPDEGSVRDCRHRTPLGGLSARGRVQFRPLLLSLHALMWVS